MSVYDDDDLFTTEKISVIPPFVDYLPYVDGDIQQMFQGKNYMNWEPLLFQLHKDMVKLYESIESKW